VTVWCRTAAATAEAENQTRRCCKIWAVAETEVTCATTPQDKQSCTACVGIGRTVGRLNSSIDKLLAVNVCSLFSRCMAVAVLPSRDL
jgi:hypothetical protein